MQIIASPEFEKALKQLKKRFPTVGNQVGDFVRALEAGNVLGDKIPEIGFNVYKVRLPNPDAQKGKSGGFRIVYYLKQQDHVWLITIYSKSDQGDVPTSLVIDRIQEYERSQEKPPESE